MNLEDYSLSELRELAKNKNIKGYSKYKKSELIDLLTENNTTNNEDKNNESVVTDSNTTYKITNSDGTTEEYVFYLEKEEAEPVFQESFMPLETEQKEIPYLSWYVGAGCFGVILILFKVIVLGFKKK